MKKLNLKRARTGGPPVPTFFLLAVLVGGAGAAPVAPPPPAAEAVASFSSFQEIGNLNIFNASRVGWVAGGVQPHVDTISFVGTLESAKGTLAFFASSNRSFQKAVGQGGTIADFTVTKIATGGVELTKDSKAFSLAMGQQLRRPPGGDWAPGVGPPVSFDVGSAAGATAAPAIPADASDLLKQMMERRQQQLKQ
jgi:hypothetical protein